MDLTPAFSSDYLSWDGVERITYESARRSIPAPDPDPLLKHGPPVVPFDGARTPNANQADQIPVAKRRALSRKELAASAGAYTGSDLVWLLPAAVLPSWLGPAGPKPGDVLIPAEGDRYTVLEVQASKGRQTFRLQTRNLAIAFDLRDTISIERPQISYDDPSGAIRKLFPTGPGPRGGETLYANLLCKVHLEDQEISEERGIRGTLRRYSIIASRELSVSVEDRVNWTVGGVTTYLEIRAYRQAQQIDELPLLECEQVP